jgi:tetratricopeptide (TPR) repeat protein
MPRLFWKIIRSPKERRSLYLSLRLALTGLSAFASSAFAAEIRDDLPQVINQLQERMEALRTSDDTSTMGVVTHSVEKAFALAEQNLKDREYIAVIRNLNYVLNQASQLPKERYMRAQYMLGSAYDELQQISRAGKAWLRYLSSYTTQEGHDSLKLLEVIRRVLLIQEKLASGQRTQLQRLLADITALQMAPELRAEIHLLAAISAIHNRNNRLADSWLEKVRAIQSSGRLWAEASFYSGLNAMQEGKEQQAEKLWLAVAGISDDTLGMIRDLAALNLGRLYAARKMPKNALQWYAKVKLPGMTARLAAYESILLLAETDQYAEASQFAQSYISNYPRTREAHELKEKLPLFLYQAGHLELAETQMRDRDKNLTELKQWLEVTTRGRLSMTGADLQAVDEEIAIYAIS